MMMVHRFTRFLTFMPFANKKGRENLGKRQKFKSLYDYHSTIPTPIYIFLLFF